VEKVVVPGKNPLLQVDPLFVVVAQPASEAPPSSNRPVWNVETSVEPHAKVSGST
jgi:hypothetical protein